MSELDDAPLTAEERLRAKWRRAARVKLANESPAQRVARLERNRVRSATRRAADPAKARRENAAAMRVWRQANPEKRRAAHAAYRDQQRERFRDYWRQRKARRRGASCVDAVAHREYALILLADPCAYCGAPADTIDHITPIARGGSDEWDNLTGACASCNSSKHAWPLLEAL